MLPADKSKAGNRAPGKNSPSVVAFINPRPQLQSITTPISIKQTPRKSKTPEVNRGFFALPISNGASPIASALGIRLGATPREHIHPNSQPRNHPIKQDISTLPGLGHFYFALTSTSCFFPVFRVNGLSSSLAVYGSPCCKPTPRQLF
jgi:hypothetical protein